MVVIQVVGREVREESAGEIQVVGTEDIRVEGVENIV